MTKFEKYCDCDDVAVENDDENNDVDGGGGSLGNIDTESSSSGVA